MGSVRAGRRAHSQEPLAVVWQTRASALRGNCDEAARLGHYLRPVGRGGWARLANAWSQIAVATTASRSPNSKQRALRSGFN